MLVNAIYFKGSWENKFNQETEKKDFKNFDKNTKIQVNIMENLFTDISYYEVEKIQMISLSYKKQKYL